MKDDIFNSIAAAAGHGGEETFAVRGIKDCPVYHAEFPIGYVHDGKARFGVSNIDGGMLFALTHTDGRSMMVSLTGNDYEMMLHAISSVLEDKTRAEAAAKGYNFAAASETVQ